MSHDEEQIARLLRTLPPAPAASVAAASELPLARRALAQIEQHLADDPARRAETERLERALAEAGFDPTPELLSAIRSELRRSEPR